MSDSYPIERIKADFKQVSKTGELMAAQNNRSTQYPLYAIQVEKRVYMPHSYMWDYDGKERLDTDYQEVDEKNLCDKCAKKYRDGGNYDELPDNCEDCDPDAFNWYKLEHVIDTMPGVFFTLENCQEHIDDNKHHYSNPQIYVISAWRNPEIQSLMRQTINIGGREVPGHYL